jgi:hypothetical protein
MLRLQFGQLIRLGALQLLDLIVVRLRQFLKDRAADVIQVLHRLEQVRLFLQYESVLRASLAKLSAMVSPVVRASRRGTSPPSRLKTWCRLGSVGPRQL